MDDVENERTTKKLLLFFFSVWGSKMGSYGRGKKTDASAVLSAPTFSSITIN